MLRRAQQLRTQIYQLKDAALFMLALLLAHWLRSNLSLDILENHPVEPFEQFAWLYLIIFPGAPLVLESQGFYKRPLFCPRQLTAWLLFKSCVLVAVGVILVMFFFKMGLARSVIILFGGISFVLVFLSEELLRLAFKSKFAQSQLKRRVIFVGTREDTARM